MKVLLTTLTLVVLFVAGAAGTYFVMPLVAPERVNEARRYLDSLDQVAAMDPMALAALTAPAPPDSAALTAVPVEDSTAVTADPASGSSAAAASGSPDPTAGGAVTGPSVGEAPAKQPAAAAREALEEKRRAEARELATVVAKLEDAELRALVASLDADVLTLLYHEASARNKTRLLQAIPPEKAGSFVRSLITPLSEK